MKQEYEKTVWDVIVIGGGAAGMMAAATAAGRGASVLLLEKNQRLGKKLSITGGGRCNVTNNKPDPREMLAKYKGRGKFLHSTFAQHAVSESITWFNERGVELKEENAGRLFPTTDSAETICETLITELETTGVTVLGGAAVQKIEKSGGQFVVTAGQQQFRARSCVLATGGTSRPETGSTGDGFTFAKALGHTINKHNVALVPIVTKERWVKQVSGVSIPDVKLRVLVDGTQVTKASGPILFTHTGLSGPTILNLSKEISDLLETGRVSLSLQTVPGPDEGAIRQTLTELFHKQSNKKVRNALTALLPGSLVRLILERAKLDPDTPCHSVRVKDKKVLAKLLFALPLTVSGLLGEDKAIISAGGVDLKEVDFKTMESKVVPNLFLVGDMLDIDRPSGGYSLQLCWSTGYVAGLHAATLPG